MILGIAITILALLTPPAPQPVAHERPVQPDSALVQSINAYRATKSLPALHTDSRLNTSAQAKAEDMVSRDYWSHNTPDGEEPWGEFDRAGYDFALAGENLAKCYESGQEIVTAWSVSTKGHNEIMLGTFEDVGFGAETKANGCEVVVAHFGSRDE